MRPLPVGAGGRSIGGDQRCSGSRRQRVDRIDRWIRQRRLGRRRRRRREYLHLASVERDGDAAIRQTTKRGDGAVKAPDLNGGRAVEAQDGGAIGDIECLAVGGEILWRA